VVQEMLLSQFVAPLRAAFPAMQPSLHIVHVGICAVLAELAPRSRRRKVNQGLAMHASRHTTETGREMGKWLHCALGTDQLQPLPHLSPQHHPPLQASQDGKTVGRIICERAEQLHAQQVFIGGSGSHHKSFVAGVLLGSSVPEYVKHHCKVPVTVVVPEGEQGGAAGQPACN
jgi:hypothetical protein